MDGYVEKLGDIGKGDLERKDLKDTVLKELGVHTENISQLTEQRKVGVKVIWCNGVCTGIGYKMGPGLRESRLLAPSGRGGREFTQPRTHLIADPCTG